MTVTSLILKPTSLCNFKCSFCSSTKLSEKDTDKLDLKYVFDTLIRFPTIQTVIVNGGDIMMTNPSYWETLLKWLDDNNHQTNISITSNLWPFYKNPDKWIHIFKNKRVGVNTSFQYDPPGSGRLKGDYTPYTEEDFWKVSNKMLELVGYRPDFISVVTKDNEHLAIKNVELAKEMSKGIKPQSMRHGKKIGVECKLNYANASGPVKWGLDKDNNLRKMGQEGDPYSLAKMYEIYLQIYDKGLHHWEYSTKQMLTVLKDKGISTTCPLSRKCDEGIRCLQPTTDKDGNTSLENKYFSCGAFGDDREKSIDFNEEIYNNKFFTPLQSDKNLFSLKKSCLTCPMFDICNGCRKYVKDSKNKGQEFIEEHCFKMKQLASRILEANGFQQEYIRDIITEYVSEIKSLDFPFKNIITNKNE